MGNIKEAVVPYFKKEFKLAKMSFDLYGAVSPTEECSKSKKDDDLKEPLIKKERTVTQVELESSTPPVSTVGKIYTPIFSFSEKSCPCQYHNFRVDTGLK